MRHTMIAAMLLAGATNASAQTFAHAKQLFDQRNFDAAKAEFAALARATPKDPVPLIFLGRIALSQNNVDEAVRQFERCGDVDDKHADCHAWLGNALGQAAQTASKFRQPILAKRVKKEFERAVELDPNNMEGRGGLVQFYMLAPGFMGGSMDKARVQAGEIEKRNKLRGAVSWALIANHDKKPADAIVAYNRAITVAPDSAVGYYGLMNVHAREKQWTEAFAAIDRLIANVPAERNALLAVARLAYLSGDQLPRGEEAAKKWIASPQAEASPNTHAVAHSRLGDVYQKMGKKELARAEYEKALKLNPKNEDAKKGLDATK